MTPDINTRLVDLPTEVAGCVVENDDSSYTIIINARMSHEKAMETYLHEMGHIYADDFSGDSVQEIELRAHKTP